MPGSGAIKGFKCLDEYDLSDRSRGEHKSFPHQTTLTPRKALYCSHCVDAGKYSMLVHVDGAGSSSAILLLPFRSSRKSTASFRNLELVQHHGSGSSLSCMHAMVRI